MKNKTTALLLTLPGIFGVAGLQYLYMGRISKFILWFLTFGIFGLDTLIDIFTIGSAVEAYNVNQELKTMRACQVKNN